MSRTLAPSTVQVIHGIVAAIFKATSDDQSLEPRSCAPSAPPKWITEDVFAAHRLGADELAGKPDEDRHLATLLTSSQEMP
jgi:hypothetical protein